MEPKGSWGSATGPYHEPDESNAHRKKLISLRSILILSYHIRLGLPRDLYPSGFSTKILYTSHSAYAHYTLHPAHLPWFDHLNDIWRRVQTLQLLKQYSPAPRHFIPLMSIYSPHTLFLNTLNLCSFVNVRNQVSHPYKSTGLDSSRKDKSKHSWNLLCSKFPREFWCVAVVQKLFNFAKF
jgi:hypothetical protein